MFRMIILQSKDFIFYFIYLILLQFDFELTADTSAKKLNSEDTCFLFEFVWLETLVMKQKLRTKFVTFSVKLRNMILLSLFKNMFYSFVNALL